MNTSVQNAKASRLKSLPKAEVHLHLEGSFGASLIAQWARLEGVSLPRPQEDLFKFSGLADFLGFLDLACGLACTTDRLVELSYGLSQRLADNGTGYADVIFNPTHWHAWHGRLGAMLEAIDAGFTQAEQDGLPSVGLCVSLLRTQSADAAIELVDMLTTMRHPRVVALSVDGNEAAAGRTGPRFADAFRRATNAGLRRTVHAGESSGPEGVWDAVELLGADRIDHGVRAIEDPALVRMLADRQIPLGICPTSNLVLRVYPSMQEHPIERLRAAGVPVSVNTDDPALLDASLVGEYALCQRTFGWNDDVTRSVAHTSIEASFANEDTKAKLLGALATW
ncbi:adenosine deaminase [Rhodoferax sp. GW822-FHT02A01]|uniref:adenosine deaminase n=1 Tax=Rhodoferax sp. GW822-FHT02A01 TaxID=3141537 RepID=UPI00315DB37D